jgi:hypothetical protein
MGSALPTVYALRGKDKEKKGKRKFTTSPNNTRKSAKNNNS